MEKYCKNCGAALDKITQVCPDCGREVENSKKYIIKYCPNCGSRIDTDENFCRNCGVQINDVEVVEESFLEKHKTTLTIATIVIIISMFIAIAILSLDSDVGQGAEFDTVAFNVPEELALYENYEIEDAVGAIHIGSKTWAGQPYSLI